jgi:hypothetical protein
MTDQELLKELRKAFDGAIDCIGTDDEGNWYVPCTTERIRYEFREWVKREHPKLNEIFEIEEHEAEIEVLRTKITKLQAELQELRSCYHCIGGCRQCDP